jgi:hypothetical protein
MQMSPGSASSAEDTEKRDSPAKPQRSRKPAASKGSPKAAKLARKAAPKQQKAPAIAHQSLAAKLV